MTTIDFPTTSFDTAVIGNASFAEPATPPAGQRIEDIPASPAAPVDPAAPAQQSANRSSTFAIVSFVLGIASIVSSWTFIAPITGLVFGILALRNQTGERTLALWGVWLNAIMLAGTALVVLFATFFLGAGALASLFYFWA